MSRLIFGLLVGIVGYCLVLTDYDHPILPREGIMGDAHLEILNLSASNHHFGKSWKYKGNLKSFKTGDKMTGKNIPVFISIPFKFDITHPPADGSYLVYGKLKQTSKGSYAFSVTQDTPWKRLEGSWSLAEARYHAKEAVKSYIQKHIHKSRSAIFLTGLATGEFDDRLMAFEFSRFGLQHLMAISGFHFGIIAYFLSLIVRTILPYRLTPWVLIVGLTSYFVFLGVTASVMRSWIGAMIFFCGQLVEKESNGLNALGVGLLAVLILDPLACKQLGFQFSFATTAAILIFHEPSVNLLGFIWPKRSLSVMSLMDLMNQHGYVVLNFFKQAVALTLAVAIVAMPMTLYFFQKFPWLSLVYNLFYPLMVSFSMILMMLGILMAWIPPLSEFIHNLNTAYTEFVLDFTYNIPTNYDINLYFNSVTADLLVCYLSLIFFFGIAYRHRNREAIEWNYPLP